MTVVEKDFLAEQVLANPYPTYRWALDNDLSVIKIPGQNVFGVFSSDLVEEVFKRTEDFSNDFSAMIAGRYADDPEVKHYTDQGWPHASVLLTTDPPVHTHQRKLVNMAFSKPRVDAIAHDIRRITTELIDAFIDKGQCEFVEEFAMPLPVHMIASQYGLSDVPRADVKRWSDAVLDRAAGLISREREIECARDLLEFQRAMIERINERRIRPSDDLLSDLVNAQVAGERPLTDTELLAILQQLVSAGNETTTNALGMGLLMLIGNPGKFEAVRADRSKIPNMVEEMLRYDSPASGTFRIATRDTELGGVRIPAQSMMMVRMSSANRDQARFADPDIFDPFRKNAHRHFSFGGGIHSCVGNMLARREMAIAFEEIMDRMANIRLLNQDITYAINVMTRGVHRIEIGFAAVAQ